jgi:hypothetical protein
MVLRVRVEVLKVMYNSIIGGRSRLTGSAGKAPKGAKRLWEPETAFAVSGRLRRVPPHILPVSSQTH